MIDSREVAMAHDAMADEYDTIDDPWYTHLFALMHQALLDAVADLRSHIPRGGRALDVGCGTGLQSYILADAGFDVDAFDLSTGLLEIARSKKINPPKWTGGSAFERAMARAHASARALSSDGTRGNISFFEGDAQDAKSYGTHKYDLIVCFGSVISFTGKPEDVLRLMRSACKAHGVVLLESEMKFNLDLFWPIIDSLLGGRLGFEQPARVSLGNLFRAVRGDLVIDYPFALQDGTELHLPMRLFSHRGLYKRIKASGFKPAKSRSIHSITNIIPSTKLHHKPGPFLDYVIRQLANIDSRVGKHWPFRRLGCSLLLQLHPDI